MTGNLFLRFPNQSQEFTLGFEAGRVYSQLIDEPEIIDTRDGFPVRRENAEFYVALGEKLGFDVYLLDVQQEGASDEELSEINAEWANVCFRYTGAPKGKQ